MVETGFMINRLSKIYRSDGTILAKEMYKCGLVDDNNCIYLDCVYDAISLFSNNYAEVVKDGKIGLINIGGYLVLECKYNAISEFDENNLARVSYNGKEGLFSSMGKWLIEPLCPIIFPAYHDKYVVCKNENFSEKDEGRVYRNDYSRYKRGDFYILRDDDRFNMDNIYRKLDLPEGKYGIIDLYGNTVVDFEYDSIYPFKDGLALVVKGSLMGAIDEFGSIIVPIIYDKIEDFFEGFAEVKSKDKWGVINTSGEIIIPLEYEKVVFCVPSQIRMQNQNDIYDFNSNGVLISQSKEFIIPRLDMGYDQITWNNCFEKVDLNFADDYSFYHAMELWNKR